MSELKKISKEQFEEAVQRNINISKKDEDGIINAINIVTFDTKENPYIYSAILMELQNKSLNEIIEGNQISPGIISSAKIKAQKYYVEEIKQKELENKKINLSKLSIEDCNKISETYKHISELYDNLTDEQKEKFSEIMKKNKCYDNVLQEFFDYAYGKKETLSEEALESPWMEVFGNPPNVDKIKEVQNVFNKDNLTIAQLDIEIKTPKEFETFSKLLSSNGLDKSFTQEELQMIKQYREESAISFSRDDEKKSAVKNDIRNSEFSCFLEQGSEIIKNVKKKDDTKLITNLKSDDIKMEIIEREGSDYLESILDEVEFVSDEDFENASVFEDIDSSDIEAYRPVDEGKKEDINVQDKNQVTKKYETSFSLDEIMDQTSQFVKITSVKREEDLIKDIVEHQYTGEKENETVEIN